MTFCIFFFFKWKIYFDVTYVSNLNEMITEDWNDVLFISNMEHAM